MELIGTHKEANGKYRAAIFLNGKHKRIGTYTTAEEAARAYQKALLDKKEKLYDTTQDWRPLPKFDKYIINPKGEVRNTKTGNILAANKNGHVTLMKDGKRVGRSINKLKKIVFEKYIAKTKKHRKKKKIQF